jgi:hypothetical protein
LNGLKNREACKEIKCNREKEDYKTTRINLLFSALAHLSAHTEGCKKGDSVKLDEILAWVDLPGDILSFKFREHTFTMIKNRTILQVVCTLLINITVFASVPDIVNFTTNDYQSHSINYGFAQDSSGMIYIANAYCVLEYDGSSFRKIPLVNGKSALSFAKDNNGRIYVGSSSEFGYLGKDSTEKTIYISLKDKILGDTEFGQIYKTTSFEGAIYFMTKSKVFKAVEDSIVELSGFSKASMVKSLIQVNNELVYWKEGEGLGTIKNNTASVFLPNNTVESVNAIQWINKDYVIFGKFGIKSISNPKLFEEASAIIGNSEITSVLKISEDEFLLGTVRSGIYVLNSSGEILRNLTIEHGLYDNYINHLFLDNAGNVWIAYNNGIGMLKWNSPIKYITKSQGFEGMGYSGVVYDERFYIATSYGLYVMDNWEEGLDKIKKFTKIEGLPENTINSLSVANGSLIISQSDETYTLIDGKPFMISPKDNQGSWVWSTSEKFKKNEAFIGHYLGASRYIYTNGNWEFKSNIAGYKESSRVLEVDYKGVIWAIQGNKGLYRVELNTERDSAISVINYASKYGFSLDYFNDIFYLENKIYITTFGGMYYLNNDSLIKDNSFNDVYKYIRRARKFDDNQIYGIYKDKAYIVHKVDGRWALQSTPVSYLKSNLVGSAEFFNKISPSKYLIGTQEGFAIYEPNVNRKTKKINCLIREVELLGDNSDSLLYNGKPNEVLSYPFEHNNFRFTVSIPAFGEMDQVVYETQLIINKNSLSGWQVVKEVNFREYTNLKEGYYTFAVRAKKGDTVLGSESYSFVVLPPWYRTGTAKFVYFILLIIAVLYIKKRFDKQTKILKAEKERELEIKEKLHNAEKLEIELRNKENELAYMALSYTQKKEMLASVVGKLDSLSKEMEHDERTKVTSLKRSISSNMDDESNWDNFQVHFDQKNNNFFQKLKNKDVKLSESYLLFCSYVRMGKSNKEIAELLTISVAAVEKRKYRLKKKWALDDDTSFTDYLKSL